MVNAMSLESHLFVQHASYLIICQVAQPLLARVSTLQERVVQLRRKQVV
jgi:hypothetical protein